MADIETLVEALPAGLTRVVAGHGGVKARRVARTAVVSSSGEIAVADGHALLVTTTDSLSERIGADGLRQAGDDVAGICVVGSVDEVPPELLSVADDLDLPLISFPDATRTDTAVIAILEALLTISESESQLVTEERFAAITLEDLVSMDPVRNGEAIERAVNLGWDLHQPRAVLLASIDPPVDPSVARRSLTTIAAAARATLGHDAILWQRSTAIAALLAPDDNSSVERRLLADRFREELDQRVQAVTISIGVGRCVDDPIALPVSFLDASRAVDVGRWAKGRHVTELYDELGLERLLASASQDDLHDFVLHAIGPLLEHDDRHQTELVATLSTWLETRNMAEASRQMYVHYNTFKNRLERIEAILGPVLDDAARLLECEVAIYIARHYDGPWKKAST